MSCLKQTPCFDDSVLKDGVAVAVKMLVYDKNVFYNAIVVRCTPLKLVLLRLNEDNKPVTGFMPVEDLSTGRVEIKVLEARW